jgi:cyclopropane fatty-acyl-phospholipid synthase-like methyltransferase
MNMENKEHWEKVFETKTAEQLSWSQQFPKTSIDFINSFKLNKKSKIIDIGGGDSRLVDFLLELGYENISVLDISEKALERSKKRLGNRAKNVDWIVTDIVNFTPKTTYDVWHDRAAFHFLTNKKQIAKYLKIAKKAVEGYLTIGTFSENGPNKCSGLNIQQYSEISLTNKFENGFDKLKCINENHQTPFNTIQNFTFCSFKKRLN